MENLREKAVRELLSEAKDNGSEVVILERALIRLNDADLFALYFEIFGRRLQP